VKFMDALVPASTAKAIAEGKDIQALIDSAGRAEGRLPAAAVGLGVLLRAGAQGEVRLDEAQVKPYFEVNNVLQNGVFYAANQLYGITFKERKDIPVYDPDVRVFEVFDAMASRWRCGTATTSSATTRAAARG
jgi:peptidyl-dipeptidase Dcp